MTRKGGTLAISFRPYESLTGFAKFKTHVKGVVIYDIPGWCAIVAELDEPNRQEYLWYPHGAVAVYEEKRA
jgi:hypothetical protein